MRKWILAAALLLMFLLTACGEQTGYVLPLDSGGIRVTESGNGALLTRVYEDPNGVRLTMQRRLCGSSNTPYTFYREALPAGAVLRLYDPDAGTWTASQPQEGVYTPNTAVLELPDGSMRFFCLPLTFAARGEDVLEYLPGQAGQLIVRRTPAGFSLAVRGMRSKNSYCTDFTMLTSPMPVLDWESDDNWAWMWERFTRDGESLFCYSGYYRFTPDNYSTTGKNCYYRCPAAFLARATRWEIGKSDAAPLVTAAILDVSMRLQNERGYFPTVLESDWLARDYGVGRNFYDTRFNTDLLELVLDFRARCGKELFRDRVERYVAFYMDFAEKHHVETEHGGWLVADYWSEDMTKEPHTSLNHQLAECLQLFLLQDDTGNAAYGVLANRLLRAVVDTAQDWIKEDHDLHYCRYADGRYGAKDYPDLTYKDIVALDRYLRKYRSRSVPALELLRTEKQIWMNAHGVKYE